MTFQKGNQFGKLGGRRKGYIPWNKGLKLDKEKYPNVGFQVGNRFRGMEGKKHTKKSKRKMSDSSKGQIAWNYIDGRSKILGPARYGDDWEAIRLLIYKRDNYTCQKCAEKMSKIPFHIHHKIPFLISFDNSPKNLITLCPSCHRKVEAIIMRELKNQKVGV